MDVQIGPPARFPDDSNTGPSGTLTTYSGPTSFSSGTVTISDKIINDDLVATSGSTCALTLQNCQVNGHIDWDQSGATLTMVDTAVDAGTWTNAGVGFGSYMSMLRCNLKGGSSPLIAGQGDFTDCYFHDPYLSPTGAQHLQAMLSSGANGMVFDHCTFWCATADNGAFGGGPTASLSLFGDFAQIQDVTVQNSLIRPCPYGVYSATWGWNPSKPFPLPTGVQVLNCAFEKGPNGMGGTGGTNTSWYASDPTNVWSGNYWLDDGTPINYDD